MKATTATKQMDNCLMDKLIISSMLTLFNE